MNKALRARLLVDITAEYLGVDGDDVIGPMGTYVAVLRLQKHGDAHWAYVCNFNGHPGVYGYLRDGDYELVEWEEEL